MNAFDRNDAVILKYHPNKIPGRIRDFRLKSSGIFEYHVYYDNKFLIPNNDWHSEGELDYNIIVNNRWFYIDTDMYCPVCNTPWKETKSPISGEIWHDCIKCNMKKESLIKASTPPKVPDYEDW